MLKSAKVRLTRGFMQLLFAISLSNCHVNFDHLVKVAKVRLTQHLTCSKIYCTVFFNHSKTV